MTAREKPVLRTPMALVRVGFGALALVQAIAWTTLPWAAAMMVTAATFLGFEVGMIGARWHDETEDAANENRRVTITPESKP